MVEGHLSLKARSLFLSDILRMPLALQQIGKLPLWAVLGTEFLLHSGLLEKAGRSREVVCPPIAEEVESLRNRVRQVEDLGTLGEVCPAPEPSHCAEGEVGDFSNRTLSAAVGNLLGGVTLVIVRKVVGCRRRSHAADRPAAERAIRRHRGGGVLA